MCDAKMVVHASIGPGPGMSRTDSGNSPGQPLNPNHPADLYSGTAEDYARYRPPYPEELLADLRLRAGTTGDGRLLDLACGPGRVALPLARYFREAWAVDQEPEMIEVGRARAERQGLTNIRWMVGPAEDVEAPPGSFELITIGEAFHRLDQRVIAERAMEWLAPGGYLATLGGFSLLRGQEPWHDVLRAVVRRYEEQGSGSQPPSERPPSRPRGAEHDRQVLTAAGLRHVGTFEFPHPHVWTLDSILGNLRSTARFSRRVLGDDAQCFDADVRRALLAHESSGRYPETLRFGYSLFRTPGSGS